MILRVCGALFLLLSACATPAPGQKAQVAVPIGPLVAPKPMTVPAPLGLNPPAPILVVPEERPDARAESAEQEQAPARASERSPECKPIPGPPRGGNDAHNQCADRVPGNNFPGLNVLVNGKHFDALVPATRTLWEVKTDDFDKHSPHSRKFFVKMKLAEMQREARLAKECGYDFIIGVRSEAHKAALRLADPTLNVVVMDWC